MEGRPEHRRRSRGHPRRPASSSAAAAVAATAVTAAASGLYRASTTATPTRRSPQSMPAQQRPDSVAAATPRWRPHAAWKERSPYPGIPGPGCPGRLGRSRPSRPRRDLRASCASLEFGWDGVGPPARCTRPRAPMPWPTRGVGWMVLVEGDPRRQTRGGRLITNMGSPPVPEQKPKGKPSCH